MKPTRIQRRRTPGWRMPPGAVYVGRPTRWGNPYRVGDLIRTPGPWGSPPVPSHGLTPGIYPERDWATGQTTTYEVRPVRDHNEAVGLFEAYVTYYDDEWPPEAIIDELAGRDLACWCPLDRPCHADILLAIANQANQEAH